MLSVVSSFLGSRHAKGFDQVYFSPESLSGLNVHGDPKSYIVSLLEVFPFHAGHSRLTLLSIHLLEFSCCKLLYVTLYQIDRLVVIRHIWPMAFETDHVKRSGSFE